MDSRQPQHPFSRNNGPPPPPPPPAYPHAPFQQPQNQAPFPTSSHPHGPPSTYHEHQRRPSESSYYAPPPAYPRDAAPLPTTNHARHRSTSSISHPSHASQMQRNMPPPSSPQQHHYHNNTPFPPASLNRSHPPALGAYQGGRDLPALSSINRPASVNSSMSISSLLGAPPGPSRDTLPPQSQYSAPPSAHATNATSQLPPPVQPSPRATPGTAPAFDRFRRPQTPETNHRRELLVRDHRSNSAGSPPKTILSTPEQHRFGTPQSHTARYSTLPPAHMPEERRDQYPHRGSISNAIPPRPSSQPVTYPGPPPHELQRGSNDTNRHDPPFARQSEQEYRRRIEEEMYREEERRRHEYNQRPEGPQHNMYNSDPRDSITWNRRAEPTHDAPPPQYQNGDEYPRPPYAGPGRDYPPHDPRYPATSYPQSVPVTQTAAPFGSPQQDRRQQPQPHTNREGLAAMVMASQYRSDQHRMAEDNNQQARHLGVQSDVNRKGRNSPLPQAVQGAQSQLSGPASEPGIKNEFGKMFSGIGSGVGSMAASQTGTPVPPHSAMISGSNRSDPENGITQDMTTEAAPKGAAPRASGASRRRKLKDEDKVEGDDSSAGRRTPSGNGRKRVKTSGHGPSKQSTAHKYDVSPPLEPAQPKVLQAQVLHNPSTAHSYTSASYPHLHEHKTGVPHHHHIGSHHHHHHHAIVQPKSSNVVIPKRRQVIRSHKVIDSVRHLPRKHLGHVLYELAIIPEGNAKASPYTSRGFRSKSALLPNFSGKENCTFTVRVPRIHLEEEARQEITSNRPLWGTDVYTDDSDIIAAAIHSGWIKGAWPVDVDASLLEGSDEEARQNESNNIDADQLFEEPPLLGPITPLPNHDIHLTILILPALERYASTVRHGIKSRDFGGSETAHHDGVSYLIMSMKLVKGVDTASEAFGSNRRSRMKLALESRDSVMDAREDALGKTFNSGTPTGTSEDALTARISSDSFMRQSAFARSNTPPSASRHPLLANKTALEISTAELLCGLGSGGWWNGRPQIDIITPPQEEPPQIVRSEPVRNGIGGQAGRNIYLLLNSAASVASHNHSRSISRGLEGLSEAAEAAEAADAMEEMGHGRSRSKGSGNGMGMDVD